MCTDALFGISPIHPSWLPWVRTCVKHICVCPYPIAAISTTLWPCHWNHRTIIVFLTKYSLFMAKTIKRQDEAWGGCTIWWRQLQYLVNMAPTYQIPVIGWHKMVRYVWHPPISDWRGIKRWYHIFLGNLFYIIAGFPRPRETTEGGNPEAKTVDNIFKLHQYLKRR